MQFLLNLNQYSDWGLLILRVAIGAIFFVHGFQKFAMWKMQPSEQMSKEMINLMRFLSIVEPLGALAVLTGFLTQFAAIGLGIIMVGAIKMKSILWHKKFTGDGGWEFDLIILAAMVVLLFSGAGSFALDRILFWL